MSTLPFPVITALLIAHSGESLRSEHLIDGDMNISAKRIEHFLFPPVLFRTLAPALTLSLHAHLCSLSKTVWEMSDPLSCSLNRSHRHGFMLMD